jgi:hypothetical protein
MKIPQPPWWLFPLILVIGILLVLLACASPHRFDPQRQQELQRQQDECLRRGGNPRECQP